MCAVVNRLIDATRFDQIHPDLHPMKTRQVGQRLVGVSWAQRLLIRLDVLLISLIVALWLC